MKKKSPLWDGLPHLIVAVIAVLAFVRGNWQLILLAGVFAVWGLWALKTMGIPVLCRKTGRKQNVSRMGGILCEAGDAKDEERSGALRSGLKIAENLPAECGYRCRYRCGRSDYTSISPPILPRIFCPDGTALLAAAPALFSPAAPL